MVKFFDPRRGARGRNKAGLEISLDDFQGWRVKRSWVSKDSDGVVVALVPSLGGGTAYVLLSEEVYLASCRIEAKKDN